MQTVKNVATHWPEFLALVFFTLIMALRAQASPAPVSVLLLMDSRSKTELGVSLDEKVRKLPGAQVTTYGLCESTPRGWMSGEGSRCGFSRRLSTGELQSSGTGSAPALGTLLGEVRPGYTVVVTGEASLKDSRRKIQSDFRDMAAAIRARGSKCIWLGPTYDPRSRDRASYYDSLRELADEVECAVADMPLLHDAEISYDVPDFVVELVKMGELDTLSE